MNVAEEILADNRAERMQKTSVLARLFENKNRLVYHEGFEEKIVVKRKWFRKRYTHP
jgi:hypothetical protein